MPVLERLTNKDETDVVMGFECPGCKIWHSFRVKGKAPTPVWTWDGDLEKPTFSPSLLVQFGWENGKHTKRCHSFVRGGNIQFLNDCTHELAGQTIPLEQISD